MQAEMIIVSFIIECNVPVASIKHAGPLFCSTITNIKDATAQIKTTAVIKSMAHFAQNGIIEILINKSFQTRNISKNIFLCLKDLKIYM